MNIFILDSDPEACVRYMNDSHVSKIILESAQMLSTVVHVTSTPSRGAQLYKPTHKDHPSVRWCADSLSNWKYLRRLALHMDDEFNYRFGGRHKSAGVIRQLPEPYLEDIGFTTPARAIPLPLRKKLGPATTLQEVVFSYRVFYNLNKRHLAKWTRRPVPYWWDRSSTRARMLGMSRSLDPFAYWRSLGVQP